MIVGGAVVQPMIQAPGTRDAADRHARGTYADNAGGLDASQSFGSAAPTLDLSVHVVRYPGASDLTYESRLLKVGRRVTVAETWFTAAGDTRALHAGDVDLRHRGRARARRDHAAVPPRLAVLAACCRSTSPSRTTRASPTVAPGVVEIEHRPSVGNGRGTLQGGMVALVAERACETLLAADGGGARRHQHRPAVPRRRCASGRSATTARILRADHEGLAQLWVELHDLGTGHLMTHVVADAIPLEAFRVR